MNLHSRQSGPSLRNPKMVGDALTTTLGVLSRLVSSHRLVISKTRKGSSLHVDAHEKSQAKAHTEGEQTYDFGWTWLDTLATDVRRRGYWATMEMDEEIGLECTALHTITQQVRSKKEPIHQPCPHLSRAAQVATNINIKARDIQEVVHWQAWAVLNYQFNSVCFAEERMVPQIQDVGKEVRSVWHLLNVFLFNF